MLSYARRCLTSRPPLWAAALGCAAVAALPGSVLMTLFVQPLTMLLLTGDALLALDVLPESLRGGGTPWVLAGVIGVSALLGIIYNRLYALLLWESDEARESGWSSSWRGTRGRWRRLLALNGMFFLAFLLALGTLVSLIRITLGSPSVATMIMLAGATALLVARTILRIYITLAARAVVLDDLGLRASWDRARSLVRERRRDVAAAWALLLAAGAAVWLGGRLITPILQDTALDYPAHSVYTFAREAAQLAFSIPLEGLLLSAAAAVWSAVYRNVEHEAAPSRRTSLMPRVLALVVVLTTIGNGIPAFLDVSWRNSRDDRLEAIREREVDPASVIRSAAGRASAKRTSYEVRAKLDGDFLEWSTRISYLNRTSAPVGEIPLYVYPAAYQRDLQAIPLADDLLSPTSAGESRTRAEPGTFEVERVGDETGALEWELEDTLLRVQLAEPLRPGEAATFTVDLEAELPSWPARYGIWNDIAQLGNWIPTVAVDAPAGFLVHPYGGIGDPFFSRTADYEVRLEVDRPIGVVGSGTLVSVDEVPGGRRRWVFSAPGMRDAAFAAGRTLRGLERKTAGARVRVWYGGSDALAGSEVAEEAASSFARYSQRYGELETEEVDVVLTDSPLGGMEYPGLVYVSAGLTQLEGLPLLPELVEHAGFERALQRYTTGHELAHQWWYADVGNDQVLEPWLDEAFAEATTRLWLRSEDGDERTWKIAHLERSARAQRGVVDASVDRFDSNEAYSEAIYDAGGAILLELRDAIGPIAYRRLLLEWHKRFSGRIATVDDFVSLSDEVAGPEARELLEHYRAGD